MILNFFVRMLGSTLVGYASLNALASYRPVRHSVDVAIWANLITLLLASLISITYVDLFDNLAWLMISQHLVFAAGFFVCVYKLKNKTPPTSRRCFLVSSGRLSSCCWFLR